VSTRRPISLVLATAAAVAWLHGCAPPPRPVAPTIVLAPPPVARPPQLPAAWKYWQPVDVFVHSTVTAPALPLTEAQITIADGAIARWHALSPEARAAVLERGFAVVARAKPTARFGEAYASLRETDVPYVVTVDTLFWLAHVTRDRALAEAEETALAPALDTLLRRLELRLTDDARSAPGDLVAPYALARGMVSVARSLLSPAYKPAPDVARVVADEGKLIAAHDKPRVSPLLGVPIDYSQIVPRGAADTSSARAAYARAVSWLTVAPFALAARGDAEGAPLAVGRARASTRAALLLARLVEFDVDAEAAYALRRWLTVVELAGGGSDDVTLRELLDVASSVGMDAHTPRGFIDAAKLARLRHALLAARAAKLDDGAAMVGVTEHAGRAVPLDYMRAATSVRILPARSTPDADVLQSLVFPSVGKLSADARAAPASARDGIRALPRALDVAAWLGSREARILLHEAGDDAYARFEDVRDALDARAPPEGSRHDSVYASSLDAIATYLAPSAADGSQPGVSTSAWRRRKVETSLAAWTTLRHDALPFARFPLASALPAPAPTRIASPAAAPLVSPPVDPRVLPAFVESHPEAIAKLLALVRQTSHGLRALREIPEASPAIPLIDASERLLADALAVALREANDEPLTEDDHEALSTFPTRLAALEATLAASQAADASLAVDVHTDLGSARALVEACGDLDDLFVVVREPHTGRLVLTVGAAATHYELEAPVRLRPTDDTWRAELHGASPPARDPFAPAFPVALVSPAGPDAGAPPSEATLAAPPH
jgi:hypothetical protein